MIGAFRVVGALRIKGYDKSSQNNYSLLSLSITQALNRNITHLPIFRICKASDNHKTKLNDRNGIDAS